MTNKETEERAIREMFRRVEFGVIWSDFVNFDDK